MGRKTNFRIGTTSYIIDAGLSQNLSYLTRNFKAVKEMQLVLFETNEFSNIPSKREVTRLKTIAESHDISFTVHMPCSIELGAFDPVERAGSIELFKRVFDITYPLSPICWTLHIISPLEFMYPEKTDKKSLRGYIERAKESMTRLSPLFDSSRDIAIENVYPHFYIEPEFIDEFDTSVCIDVGHLLYYSQDVNSHMERWLPRCRNLHLHGIEEGGKDHSSLAYLSEAFLRRLLLETLKNSTVQTVTLEIFGEEDLKSSLNALPSEIR